MPVRFPRIEAARPVGAVSRMDSDGCNFPEVSWWSHWSPDIWLSSSSKTFDKTVETTCVLPQPPLPDRTTTGFWVMRCAALIWSWSPLNSYKKIKAYHLKSKTLTFSGKGKHSTNHKCFRFSLLHHYLLNSSVHGWILGIFPNLEDCHQQTLLHYCPKWTLMGTQ